MIGTEQTVTVDCGIEDTWAYAKDFERWASIMPGYQSCEIEDADNSLWILKVGVGGLVRTVKVRVRVEQWAGPERVDFSFRLEGDPVVGSGSYLASPAGDARTEMSLNVTVEGSGPMAPMWEAMAGPVLPKFAMAFAEQLKARIEEASGVAPRQASGAERKASWGAAIARWLRSIWKAIFGRSSRGQA